MGPEASFHIMRAASAELIGDGLRNAGQEENPGGTMNRVTFASLVLMISCVMAVKGQTASQTKYSVRATRIIEDLAGGRFASVEARFAQPLAKELPEEQLSTLWKEFAAQVGPFAKSLRRKSPCNQAATAS
jgi:hypothetical protein